METTSGMITIVDNNHANIVIDCSIYELEAIHTASYEFLTNYYIIAIRKDEFSVTVIFELKDKESSRNIPEDIKEFVNTVLDHQVRLQLDRTNGKIRELIVANAFSHLDLPKEAESL